MVAWRWWGLAERRKLDAGGGGDGGGTQAVGVVQGRAGESGPMVRPAARAVFCMGRIRDEEEEGLGDVGSSSNRLKWSTDPNDKSHSTCMHTCLYIKYHHRSCLALLLNPLS